MKTPRTLIPPPRRLGEEPPSPPDLYVEPEEDLLILGEMLHDVSTMGEMLRALPFDRHRYRGNLRVALGAAVRMRDRCQRLLGEALALPEASNIIDQRTEEETLIDALRKPPITDAEIATMGAPLTSVDSQENGNGRPRKTGATPVDGGLKAAIRRTLGERGPMTAAELAEDLAKDTGANAKTVHETLAKMRASREVLHSQMGRKILNRLPA